MNIKSALEPNLKSLLKTAVEKHQSGQLDEAELLYRQILQTQLDRGDVKDGLENLYHLILTDFGDVLQKQGKLEEALQAYQQALRINPNLAQAHHNLGTLFRQQGKLEEALQAYQQALKINPNFAQAHHNLGIVLRQQVKIAAQKHQSGQLDEAELLYRQILQTQLDSVDAKGSLENLYHLILTDFGNVLKQQGKLEEALQAYQQALKINPNLAQAHNNLGNVLKQQGKLKEAFQAYQQALKINPNLAQVYNNLGNVLKEHEKLEQATQFYQKALELKPDLAEAYNNLGATLRQEGKLEEALPFYEQALKLNSNCADAAFGLCISQLPIIYSSVEEIKLRRHNYQQYLQKLADRYQNATEKQRANAASTVGSTQPFYLAYQGLNDRSLQQTYGELICQLMSSRYPQWSQPLKLPNLAAGEKIRVGFISGFFREHSNWKIPLKGWVENLDKNTFELLGYHTSLQQDQNTTRAAKAFTKFIQGPLPIEQWCKLIRQDNLHILIFPEFGMDPVTVQLGSLRLAPIQMTSWGHPETSGLPTIDYFLSSDLMESEKAQEYYTEKLVRLPNLSIHYTPLKIQPQARCKAEIGIDNDEIMFWCCQSLYKYLPQHDDVFPRIANVLENCKFVFIKYVASDNSDKVTDLFCQRLSDAFKKFGLNYQDYCIFLAQMDVSMFAATTAIADVFLDSIGWSGCNSALEAIAYNLPIVTLAGDLMRGRHTLALLKMMGIEETIASSKDDYVRIAVRLGQSPHYRQKISQQVAQNKHKLYGDLTPIRALENFLWKLVY